MKRIGNFIAALVLAAAPLAAQIQIRLDNLAPKAKESVDISLDSAMLKLAGGFFSGNKSSDTAGLQSLISGLKNITVKSYTFDKDGQYNPADLEPVRSQFRSGGWIRMIGVHEKNEDTDIFSKSDGGQIAGLAVVSAEPREVTVVYIEGSIDLAKLANLAGHFGIPALPIPGAKPADQQKKGTDQ